VADLVVDLLEVVEVEDDQREVPLVPLRACDLAAECLVEEAAVVEAGEGVEVGELPRLSEAPCVLDRRARPERELFEAAQVLLVEGLRGRPSEDEQVPEQLRVAVERHRQARVDDVLVRLQFLRRVAVDDRDRAGRLAVGRARDGLPLGLLLRETKRCDERLPVVCGDADHGRVDIGHRTRGVERAREHLVEVDRPGELAQEAAPPALLLGALDGRDELLRHLVHARRQAGDELCDLRVSLLDRAPEEENHREHEDEDPQPRADRDEYGCHSTFPPLHVPSSRGTLSL
jgi:hypothetical protein